MDLLALLLFNSSILLLMFLYFRKRIDQELTAERAIEKVREEIGLLVAELNKTTERNITLIEDRVRRVAQEVERADRSLSALTRVRETTERTVETYNALGRRSVRSNEESSLDVGKPAEPVENKSEVTVAPENDRRSLRDSVFELHRQGVPVDEIAARLGGTIAEIELMVGLGPTGRRSRTD
ncbi:MAG: hypothetical protein EA383_04730 [Spirochaetaceae bacterium]|nr:MAG: hypothetical protein EA383_04730 [Spirochaetaceae bacterium]